jgi:hypothetical protein
VKEFRADTMGETPKRIDHQEHNRFFDACFDIGVHDLRKAFLKMGTGCFIKE